ncbi:MAG: hypothetical protein F4Z76_10175, partial [Rhodothermaceae bacterium]|nr:hypothetical protein [Rhodothermaceae bacterium]
MKGEMDSRKIIVGIFLFGGENLFRVCVRHALNFVGLWVMFSPIVVLGQVHTPTVQFHTDVTDPLVLLNPNLQALEGREREVVHDPVMLSAERRTSAFEAIRVSEGDLSQRSPASVLPLFTHGGSNTSIFVPPIDPTDGSVGNHLRDFKHVQGNAQNSLMIFGEDSNAAITGSQPPLDTNYGNFAVMMDELSRGLEFGSPSPAMIMDPDANLEVCLNLSPSEAAGGDSVAVTATVQPVHTQDIAVKLEFGAGTRLHSYLSGNNVTITIPAGASESDPFKFKIRENVKKGWKVQSSVEGIIPNVPRDPYGCLFQHLNMGPPRTITLGPDETVVEEGDRAKIVAVISYPLSSDLKVPLHYPYASTTDTAVDPGDYTSLDSIIIKAGESSGSGQIQTHKDNAGGGYRTFTVAIDDFTLVSPTYAPVYAVDPKEAKVVINDDDVPVVRFDSYESSVDEADTEYRVFVTIDPPPVSGFTLNYEFVGTATQGLDYEIENPRTVAVSAGSKQAYISVMIKDDTDIENNENIIFGTRVGAGYTIRQPIAHTLVIKDNDTPEVNFVSSSSSVEEGIGTQNVRVTLTSAPASDLTLSYTLSGTADEDVDYTIINSGTIIMPAKTSSVDIPVVITNDTEGELVETVILTLMPATGYTVGSQKEHTLTIKDNDTPAAHFASATGRVKEGDGPHTVSVDISPSPASDFTLSYTLGGTADEDSDYTITGSVLVSANATLVNIPVTIIDDQLDELDETVILTLTAGTEYSVGSPGEHTLTITDNDEPYARFASTASSALEDTGTHEIEVLIDPVPASDFTLSYTLGGTADEDSDYTITGSVLVSANATLVNIPVTIIDDQLDELDETVILTLTAGTEYSVGSPGEHT